MVHVHVATFYRRQKKLPLNLYASFVRRPLQLVMVEGGVLGWLLRLLADQEPLSEYTLRYTLALLMNLCLRTAGERQPRGRSDQTTSVSVPLQGRRCVFPLALWP